MARDLELCLVVIPPAFPQKTTKVIAVKSIKYLIPTWLEYLPTFPVSAFVIMMQALA